MRDAAVELKGRFAVKGDLSTVPVKARRGSRGGNSPAFADANVPPQGFGHPYLAEGGLWSKTAEIFGMCLFSGKGSLSGRIVIPIHNESAGGLHRGQLIAMRRDISQRTSTRAICSSTFRPKKSDDAAEC